MGILLSKFRFNFNSIQTLKSRLHGNLCHIRFGDLWSFKAEADFFQAIFSQLLNLNAFIIAENAFVTAVVVHLLNLLNISYVSILSNLTSSLGIKRGGVIVSLS